MANPEHVAILRRGVEHWNRWRLEDPSCLPDLSLEDLTRIELPNANLAKVNLTKATLRDASLMRAVLTGAKLQNADLYQTEFYRANMQSAELDGADASGAKFHRADLSGASLQGTQLFRVDFIETILNGARFRQSNFGLTTFASVDLSQVSGLGEAVHVAPSNIDVATLLRSVQGTPIEFFISAGIQESFIRHVLSYRQSPDQFLSCFISYSMKDQDFADRLHSDLQGRGIRCWFAPHDIQGGRKIHEQIEEAIRVYDKLLLIVSDASMSSNWVKTEIANARAKEVQQKRTMLFPISIAQFDSVRSWKCFDADTGIDSAREIREYFIPDFSNWKIHDAYAKAFDLLVRSLKADAARPATEGIG